jgi:hypothetical protein
MPATHYKIWGWGDYLERGVMGSRHVGVAGVAKKATEDQPFAVANELICGYLARVLLLPVPPGFVVEREGEPYYVSLNFNLAGQSLPPANPRRLVEDHPRLACGIILFDCWILNHDRHPENLAYDTISRRVQLFDHSHAILPAGMGGEWLDHNRDRLGIGGHCLKSEITSLDGMRYWYDRINAVPEYYIEEVVRAAAEVGLPTELVGSCTDFLLERRRNLLTLVAAHRGEFQQLQPELWEMLEDARVEADAQDEGQLAATLANSSGGDDE